MSWDRKLMTRVLRAGCIVTLGVGMAACAGGGERPDAALAQAQASIDSAEQAGAREYGAADLDTARTKLTRARMLADDGENEEALQLAEQATVDARLAGAKGITGKSRESLAQLRDSTRTLREEVSRPEPAPVAPGEAPQ
jgi:hypothetical protein